MAIAYVQGKASASNAATQSLAFDTNVGQGSLIMVAIRDSGNAGSGSSTVSDTRGSTYALARQVASGGGTVRLYVGITATSGACTVSISGGSGTNARLTITEFTSLITSTTADATNAANATTSGPLSTGTVTPSNANALLFAVLGTSTDTTFTGAGSGWTLLSAGLSRVIAAYRIVSSVITYNADFSWSSGATDAGAVIAVFSEPAAAVSTPAFGRYGVRGPVR